MGSGIKDPIMSEQVQSKPEIVNVKTSNTTLEVSYEPQAVATNYSLNCR